MTGHTEIFLLQFLGTSLTVNHSTAEPRLCSVRITCMIRCPETLAGLLML